MDIETKNLYRTALAETFKSVNYLGQFFVFDLCNGFDIHVDEFAVYSERAIRYGREIGIGTEYVVTCLRECFTSGIRRSIKWMEENTTYAVETLQLLKGVI